MTRKMICIVCPRGCALTVENGQGGVTVTGNACPKGKAYGEVELVAPKRTVTTVVKVANRTDTMVSVKTASPVPKEKMAAVVAYCRTLTVNAPVYVGDVISYGVFGADIVVTKEII